MADKGSKREVEELENVDTAPAEAPTEVAAPAEAPTEYDAAKDLKMNITLYKKVDDEKNYKIYIHGEINVTKPGEQEKKIDVPAENRLVSDSKKEEEVNTNMIKLITDLINKTDAAAFPPPPPTAPTAQQVGVGVGDAAAQVGGYSSKSVSFRPFKKRRTVKKRRGRK